MTDVFKDQHTGYDSEVFAQLDPDKITDDFVLGFMSAISMTANACEEGEVTDIERKVIRDSLGDDLVKRMFSDWSLFFANRLEDQMRNLVGDERVDQYFDVLRTVVAAVDGGNRWFK